MKICKVDHRVTRGLSNYNHGYSLKMPGAGGHISLKLQAWAFKRKTIDVMIQIRDDNL